LKHVKRVINTEVLFLIYIDQFWLLLLGWSYEPFALILRIPRAVNLAESSLGMSQKCSSSHLFILRYRALLSRAIKRDDRHDCIGNFVYQLKRRNLSVRKSQSISVKIKHKWYKINTTCARARMCVTRL